MASAACRWRASHARSSTIPATRSGPQSLSTTSALVAAAAPQLRFSERRLRELLAPLRLGRQER